MPRPIDAPALLEGRKLDSYYGQSHILRGISIAIRPGETIGLMGRNGMGKTTLIRTLVGLIRARRGEVILDGQNVTHAPTFAIARRGIAYVPFFPLGGFTPLQSSALDAAASAMKATPMQVALAWLLQRSPNILLIPGTSSLEHLRENLEAAALKLPTEMIANLETINEMSEAITKSSATQSSALQIS